MAFVFKVVIVMLAASFGWSAGCGGDDAPGPTPSNSATPQATALSATPTTDGVRIVKVASGFTRPTFVTNAGDGTGRLFVVEKAGKIRIVNAGNVASQAFLDITSTVLSSGNEQGLLGLVFHRQFKQNGRFFVAYTSRSGDNTVAEYRVSADPNRADAASGRVLFGVKDPFPNHNGGMLAFGKDGYLYVSMGDGGSAGDPNGNAQNLDSLLGKLLRIDVNSGEPYGVPKDNPFVGRAGARAEIWAYGLRNPWR